MKTITKHLPWAGLSSNRIQDATACNWAFGHLVGNLPRRLTVDGRIHAETYISAVGAIAGYAAQRTLFAASPPVPGVNINRYQMKSGEQYWFGDALNNMLALATEATANRCVWSQAMGGAIAAGIKAHDVPDLGVMFSHVAKTIGGADEGTSSVEPNHQPHLRARELLKFVWPVAVACFSGKGANVEYGAVPVEWWSAIAAQAANKPVRDVKDTLPPHVAVTLLMEAAIYCSKLDQAIIEAA